MGQKVAPRTWFTPRQAQLLEVVAPKKQGTGIKIRDIAVNKLEAIHNRTLARDYIDLYLIMTREKISPQQLLRWHQRKTQFETNPLDWSKAFLKSQSITALPRMYIPFSRPKMIQFYEGLARSLEPEIFL